MQHPARIPTIISCVFVFFSENTNSQYIIISNKKRFNAVSHSQDEFEILTSNISVENQKNRLIFDYRQSLPNKYKKSDSALLILLTILEKANVKRIYLAGFDGFTQKSNKNFYSSNVTFVLDSNFIAELNETLRKNIELFRENIEIKSIVPSMNIPEI